MFKYKNVYIDYFYLPLLLCNLFVLYMVIYTVNLLFSFYFVFQEDEFWQLLANILQKTSIVSGDVSSRERGQRHYSFLDICKSSKTCRSSCCSTV